MALPTRWCAPTRSCGRMCASSSSWTAAGRSRPPATPTAGLRAVLAALGGSRVFAMPLQTVAAGPAPRTSDIALQIEPAPDPPATLLRPLGQVLDGYLVAEGPDGIILIDQHAAHERVLYNRFLSRLRGAPAPSQPLLLPQVVELEPSLVAAAADHGERLNALGFEVEGFGQGAVHVRAAPVETPAGRIEEALLDLLSSLAGSRAEDRQERAAASIACHSAVRFGDSMDLSEQRRLLEELERTPDSITCPHGRPTRLELSSQELRRHFRRNY